MKKGGFKRPSFATMNTSSVIWSERAYTLRDVHRYFELPQVVCVEDGYYDEKDETTLSRDDVLTLHVLQTSRFYKAVNRNGREINIPVNLAATVETVSCVPYGIYHSIQELINVSAKRVKSIHNHPWLLIQAGDTLQVREENSDSGVESLRFSFVSKAQDDVNIPIGYKADFQVIPDITKLWLTEVEETFELPVRVKFTDATLQIKPDENGGTSCENLETIADLGDVTLQSIHQIDQFVASTKIEHRTMVLKIPADIEEITVKPGVGIEHEDYTYVDVCQFYHEKARLYQLDDLDEECIRIGETDAKVERIYEFVDEDDGHDYVVVPPQVPSRVNRLPLHPEKELSSDDDDDNDNASCDEGDDYEEMTETPPPPIPTRISSIPQNSNAKKTSTSNQNICSRILCCLRTSNENRSNSAVKANMYKDTIEVPVDQRRYVDDSTIRSNNTSFKDRPSLEAVQRPGNNNATVTAFPESLYPLDVEGVARCLKGLNMEQHVAQFRNGQINGSLFVTLTDELLVSLGVDSKFQRAKLMKFIGGWRPDRNAAHN